MKKLEQQTIPIVQQDLSHEETIVQIAFSLDALEKVVSNIFSSVECAVERKKKRLHVIQDRCEIAKQKVEKLSNFNKSIKVFSCYKYPSPQSELFYKDPLCRSVEINEPMIKVKCSALPPDKFSLKEKLKFYHVRDSSQALKHICETTPVEGLGILSSNCSSINALLLYNTNQNLYKQYKIVDPLFNINKQADLTIRNDKSRVIQPDPISIGSSEPLGYKNIHHYFYSPSFQDVPEIEAPVNLPRLTGIAGDLSYNVDQQVSDKHDVHVLSLKNPTENEIKLREINVVDQSLSINPELPPPPPPLPSSILFETQDEPVLIPNVKTETLVPSDVRANLMEAIRRAGGKSKLKHVSSGKPEKDISQSKSLMDDLHEKLHMRRKGISGKVDNTDGILDRIVSMIPPPPTQVKQIEHDDDEEWDD